MLSFCIVLCFNTIGLVQTVANEDKKGTTVAFTHASFPICLNKCEVLWNLNTDALEATMRWRLIIKINIKYSSRRKL